MTLPLAIGILSWGQHKTLRNTLDSYVANGLLEKAAQVFIFFQEMSDQDFKISEEYGIEAIGAVTNLGIAEGYRSMLEHVDQTFYLFLENDWVHISKDSLRNKHQIEEGIELLSTDISVVRYRSTAVPGNPLWTAQFQGNELSRPEHLLDSAYWINDPSNVFPSYIQRRKVHVHPWYYTFSRYANWTNNPHMVQTHWAKEVLEPKLGDKDIEKDLQNWWQKQKFAVAQGEGLFTHWRIG